MYELLGGDSSCRRSAGPHRRLQAFLAEMPEGVALAEGDYRRWAQSATSAMRAGRAGRASSRAQTGSGRGCS